mmetsp:Transcript_28455/g.71953  ORF Transcript_28455/g.71953 Transcript_28455/m.71953 type:complete len:250 (-) Transcript_28455:144-893(-)
MAADEQERGDFRGEDGQVDEDQPVHDHRKHRANGICVLHPLARRALSCGPVLRPGAPEHGLLGAHDGKQEHEHEADEVVHVLLLAGNGSPCILVGAWPVIITEHAQHFPDLLLHSVLECVERLHHLRVVDAAVAIRVNLLDNPAHGVAAPHPDAVEVEARQSPHARDVVEQPANKDEKPDGAYVGFVGFLVLAILDPPWQDLLAEDEHDQAEHVPHARVDELHAHHATPERVRHRRNNRVGDDGRISRG